jgi:hypothetical protein
VELPADSSLCDTDVDEPAIHSMLQYRVRVNNVSVAEGDMCDDPLEEANAWLDLKDYCEDHCYGSSENVHSVNYVFSRQSEDGLMKEGSAEKVGYDASHQDFKMPAEEEIKNMPAGMTSAEDDIPVGMTSTEEDFKKMPAGMTPSEDQNKNIPAEDDKTASVKKDKRDHAEVYKVNELPVGEDSKNFKRVTINVPIESGEFKLEGMIDSGAEVTIIRKDMASKLQLFKALTDEQKDEINDEVPKLEGANGTEIKTYGRHLALLKLLDSEIVHPVVIADINTPLILGVDF